MNLSNPIIFKTKKTTCNLWKISYQTWKGAGLSKNLGNPRGFDATELKELGKSLLKGYYLQ
jgi:hypothetical protein